MKTMNQIINDLERFNLCVCLWCGDNPGSFKHYDHSGGWPVNGFNEKQWIYSECFTCGRRYSINKIFRRLNQGFDIITMKTRDLNQAKFRFLEYQWKLYFYESKRVLEIYTKFMEIYAQEIDFWERHESGQISFELERFHEILRTHLDIKVFSHLEGSK